MLQRKPPTFMATILHFCKLVGKTSFPGQFKSRQAARLAPNLQTKQNKTCPPDTRDSPSQPPMAPTRPGRWPPRPRPRRPGTARPKPRSPRRNSPPQHTQGTWGPSRNGQGRFSYGFTRRPQRKTILRGNSFEGLPLVLRGTWKKMILKRKLLLRNPPFFGVHVKL